MMTMAPPMMKMNEDLRKLTLSDCNLTATQWSHSEIYEGIFNPAREAMTRLQASKYNTTAIVFPIIGKLRDIYEGDEFEIHCRQLGNASHKDVRAYKYDKKVFTREMLPPWAIKCCELMVEQLNARFLQRKMNKWVYIAMALDPRIKNIAGHHAPLMLVTPDPPPANKCGTATSTCHQYHQSRLLESVQR
jgi:hypothetical protein